MNNRKYIIWILFCLASLFTSCGPDASTLQATIDAQVVAGVAATVAATPSATANSTYTPYPTLTPLATFTPLPTYTFQPTYTHQPTFTPLPTSTPLPTNTSEPTATATATQAPTSVIVPTQSAATLQSDPQSEVLAAIESLLHDIESYQAAIRHVITGSQYFGFHKDDTVRCQGVVNAYNHGLTTINVQVAQASVTVQNAYNAYLAALPLFQEAGHTWAELCQEALVNGEEKHISAHAIGIIGQQMDVIKDMLNSVANEFRSG